MSNLENLKTGEQKALAMEPLVDNLIAAIKDYQIFMDNLEAVTEEELEVWKHSGVIMRLSKKLINLERRINRI